MGRFIASPALFAEAKKQGKSISAYQLQRQFSGELNRYSIGVAAGTGV